MEQAAYPSWERGKGGIMKRLFILLTVCILILAGCSDQKEQPITERQSVETTSQVKETENTEVRETENVETKEAETAEADNAGESVQAETEESKEEPEHTMEPEKPQQETEQSKPDATTPSQEKKPEPEPPASTEVPTTTPTEPEQTKEQSTEAPTEAEAVAYSPNEVVSLATAKTKAYGKISIPEDLDNMLANGEITKEEYDAYYPYDGAGYYSVFVETDLNEASTTSGRKLESVEGIADYISGMLALETGPYFYIEYTGITNTGGKDFYEFRCYRA